MSKSERKFLVLIAVVCGTSSYIANEVFSHVVLIELPQSADAVTGTLDIPMADQYGSEHSFQIATHFKNEFEKLKYEHNTNIENKRSAWVVYNMWFGAVLGYLLLYSLPKRRNMKPFFSKTRDYEEKFTICFLSSIFWAVVPLIVAIFAPSPSTWLPTKILEYHDHEKQNALRQLKRLSSY